MSAFFYFIIIKPEHTNSLSFNLLIERDRSKRNEEIQTSVQHLSSKRYIVDEC